MEIIRPSGVYDIPLYSHAVKVDNTFYVSGQIAYDEEGRLVGLGDIGAQTEQVMRNLQKVLEAAGASLQNVVKTTCYLTNATNLPKFFQVRQKHFGGHVPAATTVMIAALADSGLLVEVEAIAVIGK